jgi:putative ABC transport system ATP-binding protein
MIEIERLSKTYRQGNQVVPVLRDVDLCVSAGAFIAIMGTSGLGKSTLLNVLGLLDDYDSGIYRLDGMLIRQPSEQQAAHLRNRLIGFVFQAFHLLPFFCAWENVALPLQYQGVDTRQRRRRASALLARLGLADRLRHFPHALSGGERQRVAIARALVAQPRVVLADEPTGNLDSKTARDIMRYLADLHRDGVTIVMVTHEEDIAAYAQSVIRLHDGQIV